MIDKILILTGFLILASCSPIRTPRLEDHEAIKLGGLAHDQELERLRAVSQEVKSYRSLSHAEISDGESASELRYAIVFVKPGKLRLEALPLTAAYTLSLLVSSGGSYTLLEPNEKRAYSSSDGLRLVRRVLKLPLKEDELMSLVIGRIPEKFLGADMEPLLAMDDRRMLVLTSNEGAVRFECDPISHVVMRAEYTEAFRGEKALVVHYDSFEPINSVLIPKGIELELPREGVRIRLAVQSAHANGEIRDKLFQVTVPPDYELREE